MYINTTYVHSFPLNFVFIGTKGTESEQISIAFFFIPICYSIVLSNCTHVGYLFSFLILWFSSIRWVTQKHCFRHPVYNVVVVSPSGLFSTFFVLYPCMTQLLFMSTTSLILSDRDNSEHTETVSCTLKIHLWILEKSEHDCT